MLPVEASRTPVRLIPEVPQGFSVREVRVAGNRGACGGVELTLLAVAQVRKIIPPDIRIWTTNNPVNFPPAFKQYGDGLKNANGDISIVPDGAVCIISAHGFEPKAIREAEKRGVFFIDTTCPYVLNEQEKVRQAQADEVHSVFIGEENHPETLGVKGQVDPENITVFDPSKEIEDVSIPDGARVFAKTTNDPEQTAQAINRLLEINPTIDTSAAHSCYALRNRFAAGRQLVEHVDSWLVVGDESSHNARGIRDIAKSRETPRHLVRGPEDIDWSWFGPGIERLGVSSAASVPEEYTQRVLDPFRALGIPVIEMPQIIPEAYRIFRLPEAQIEALRQRYPSNML